MKGNILIVVLLFVSLNMVAQIPSATITCMSGCGEISFYFNTIKKYEDGITSPIKTQLQVRYDDNGDAAARWALMIDTDNATIDREDGLQTLNLNTLEISVDCPLCAPANVKAGFNALPGPPLVGPFGDPYDLPNPSAYEFIREEAPNPAPAALYTIELTWRCGNGGALLGEEPGYYSVNANLRLMTNR